MKAIETSTPKRESDFVNFLYNPENRTVILYDSKGKTISAHRISNNNDKEYLQRKHIKMKRGKLDKILYLCTQEFLVRSRALELLG